MSDWKDQTSDWKVTDCRIVKPILSVSMPTDTTELLHLADSIDSGGTQHEFAALIRVIAKLTQRIEQLESRG